MTIITLNPPPGGYTEPQVVKVTGPAGYSVQVTRDGRDPVIVRTVAGTDKFAPDVYPYIQAIDDGRGRAIFDGSFPKYYNSNWNSSTSFYGLTSGCKFLYNAINYLRQGRTRILFLGDKGIAQEPLDGPHKIKGTGRDDFRHTMAGIAELLGLDYAFRDASDWAGNEVNISFAECMQYDVIFFMSSNLDQPAISSSAAANIAQARRQGVGIYICTDNGHVAKNSTERYPEGFYLNANVVVEAITNANFTGNMDFDPGKTVAYNKATFGDSPMFAGMDDTENVFASTSDSFIDQEVTPLEELPITVTIPEGYTTLKFAIVDPSGNVTFDQFGYNVGQPPIIELLDGNNNVIEELPPTNLRQQYVRFRYLPGTFGNASGFIRANDTVIATFTNVPAGIVDADWLVTDYTLPFSPGEIFIPGDENPNIYVDLFEPIVYSYQWSLNRNVPSAPSTDLSKFVQQVNKNEMFVPDVNVMGPLNKALELLSLPAATPDIRLPVLVNNIYEAWTRRIPSFALIPTPQEIKANWPQYIMSHSIETSDDANFIITDNVITNTVNANCHNVLLSPYLSPSIYQYVKLSSTNRDDDWVGLLVGMQEDSQNMRIYVISICLRNYYDQEDQNDPWPTLALEVMTIPAGSAPGLPNKVFSQPIDVSVLARFPEYPAQNSSGYAGWISPHWVDGIYLDTSFDGESLRVRCTAPGAAAGTPFYVNTILNATTHPVLAGAEPRAGLHVRSQPGSRWEGYTVVRTG